MTRPLPFTEASIARAIKGVMRAGLFVVGIAPNGTLIIGDKPVDAASLVPVELEQSSAPAKRMGEYFNGGQGET